MIAYLIECRFCGKQSNGSTVIEFHAGSNNYEAAQQVFWK